MGSITIVCTGRMRNIMKSSILSCESQDKMVRIKAVISESDIWFFFLKIIVKIYSGYFPGTEVVGKGRHVFPFSFKIPDRCVFFNYLLFFFSSITFILLFFTEKSHHRSKPP